MAEAFNILQSQVNFGDFLQSLANFANLAIFANLGNFCDFGIFFFSSKFRQLWSQSPSGRKEGLV